MKPGIGTVLHDVLKIAHSGAWLRSLHAAVCSVLLNIRGEMLHIKSNFTLERAVKARFRIEVYLYSFFNLGAILGGCSTPFPDIFTAGKETRYLYCMGLSGPQCRPGRMRKIFPLPVFDPWTVKPVASCCTDCAVQAHGEICRGS